MNMDRSQKNLEKKKDDRTIEYLELKYDTNIQRGLTLAKVRQKQRGKRSSRNSITKEKKRIWFMCLKQECQNLLFFFFLYCLRLRGWLHQVLPELICSSALI